MGEATIPTVSQVKNWQLDALEQQGTYWTQQAGKVKTELDGFHTTVGNSLDYLIGKFGTGVRDKGVSVRDNGYKSVGALEAAGTAITVGSPGMRFAQQTVTQLLTTITSGGYLWGEDGGVTLSLSQLANAMSDKDNGTIKLAVLQRQADQYATMMKAALSAAGVAAQGVADGVTNAFSELPNAGGTTPPVNGDTGEQLGEKVSKSEQIPPEVLTQIDQVLDQTNLSPEELADLQDGETVVVPASTLEFTQKFLESAGPEGFAKLSEQLRAQGPEGEAKAQALANSFMLLSNENVKGVKGDGKQTQGGYEQLPQEYRDIISSRVLENPGTQLPGNPGFLPDANTNRYPDPDGLGQYRAGIQYYQNLAGLTTALDAADDSYTPGTKLSTELYRQGGQLASMLNANTENNWGLPVDRAMLETTLDNIVDVGTNNTDATAIILTGEGTPEQLGANYHRDSTVVSLLKYDWPGGVENSPIKDMFDWIYEDATVGVPPGDPNYQQQLDNATRAGESARALADIVSSTKSPDGINNFDVLFNDNDTAKRYVAAALAPYVGNMVGADEALVGTHGFGTLNPVESTRVFTLMNTDDVAAPLLNGAALATAYEFDRAFANDPDNSKLGLYSGRLQGLIDGGLAGELGLNSYDDAAEYAHRKEVYGAQFMAAKEWVNLPLKLVPGEKYIFSPMVSSIEALLKDSYVGWRNDKPELTYPVLNYEMPDGHDDDPKPAPSQQTRDAAQRYVILQALVESGQIPQSTLPSELAENGVLKPWNQTTDEDLTVIPGFLGQNGFDEDRLTQYVRDTDSGSGIVNTVVFGGDLVDPGSKVFVDVLRAGGVPDDVNRWDRPRR